MKLRLAFVLGIVLAFLPSTSVAQEPGLGLIGAIDRDLRLPSGDRVDAVFVIGGNVIIEGTVEDFVFVIDGDVRVSGEVQGRITVINGSVVLLSGSSVKDVSLIDSRVERSEGASVTGAVDEEGDLALDGFNFEALGWALSVFFWVTFTIAVVAAALLFAAIGGSQLRRAATALIDEAGKTLTGAVVAWIALPIAGVIAAITIVGLGLGLTLLFFVLPALWFLGYVVAGTRLGGWLTGMTGRPMGEHPYLAAAAGVFLLQLLVWVPFAGAFLVAIAGAWGGGAVLLIASRAVRGRSEPPPATSAPSASF